MKAIVIDIVKRNDDDVNIKIDKNRKKTGVVLSIITTTIVVACHWLINNFDIIPIEQYIFHLKVPLSGCNYNVFYDALKYCIPRIIVIVSLVYFVLYFVKCPYILRITIKIKDRLKQFLFKPLETIKKKYVSLNILCLVIVVVMYSNKLGVVEYVRANFQTTTMFEDEYVDPSSVDIVFPDEKRNLIFIQLESMESSYASTNEGGGFEVNLIPELTELANNNVNFSNNEGFGGFYKTYGATWTIAAMVAQTSGLPLKVAIDGNDYGMYSSFLANAITLGDILYENGYNQYLMMGSNAEFGGRSQYFSQHGNYEIIDYNYAIESGWIEEDYYVWWGYEDTKLFEYAKEVLLDISNQDEPFNLHLLTVDTHFTDGYLDVNAPIIYDQQFCNVLSYSSTIINEFIVWIQEQEFYENTTIVITGDHLSMDESFFNQVNDDYERMVYNTFINSVVEPYSTTSRVATAFDIYPSVLASLGVQIEGDRLALGTNLFSNKLTIAEELGIVYVNKELEKKSKFYDDYFIYNKNKKY